jgi:GH24 family phage-related lysozyme (muramidase)
MITLHPLSQAKYEELRFELIKDLERKRTDVYDDGKGVPTIGIGYNLRVVAVADLVVKSLGVTTDNLVEGSAVFVAEDAYRVALRDICTNTALSVAQVKSQLDTKMFLITTLAKPCYTVFKYSIDC